MPVYFPLNGNKAIVEVKVECLSPASDDRVFAVQPLKLRESSKACCLDALQTTCQFFETDERPSGLKRFFVNRIRGVKLRFEVVYPELPAKPDINIQGQSMERAIFGAVAEFVLRRWFSEVQFNWLTPNLVLSGDLINFQAEGLKGKLEVVRAWTTDGVADGQPVTFITSSDPAQCTSDLPFQCVSLESGFNVLFAWICQSLLAQCSQSLAQPQQVPANVSASTLATRLIETCYPERNPGYEVRQALERYVRNQEPLAGDDQLDQALLAMAALNSLKEMLPRRTSPIIAEGPFVPPVERAAREVPGAILGEPGVHRSSPTAWIALSLGAMAVSVAIWFWRTNGFDHRTRNLAVTPTPLLASPTAPSAATLSPAVGLGVAPPRQSSAARFTRRANPKSSSGEVTLTATASDTTSGTLASSSNDAHPALQSDLAACLRRCWEDKQPSDLCTAGCQDRFGD